MPLFARLARLGSPRRAVGGRDEPRVAAPAAPALGDEHALAVLGEVGEQAQVSPVAGSFSKTSVPIGTGDLEVVGRLAGAVGALAVLAAAGLELGVEAEVDEGVLGGSRDDVDRAAVAAVAAVGTAARDELLAAEAQAAAPAVAGGDVDVDLIDEHRLISIRAIGLTGIQAGVRGAAIRPPAVPSSSPAT